MDREKLISGIEHCRGVWACMADCPYWDTKKVCKLHDDMLEFLQKPEKRQFLVDEDGHITPLPVREDQVPVTPTRMKIDIRVELLLKYSCGNCGEGLFEDQPYCMRCGKAQSWKEMKSNV